MNEKQTQRLIDILEAAGFVSEEETPDEKEKHDAFQESKEADYIPGQDDGEGPPTTEEEPGDLRV